MTITGKIIENFNSLQIVYRIYNIDEKEDSPVFESEDIRDIFQELRNRKDHNGLNWNVNLLLSIETPGGINIAWIDVENIELFI